MSGQAQHRMRRAICRVAACATAPLIVLAACHPALADGTAAAGAGATARIQALLDDPVNGVVHLPSGTFTVRPALRLRHGETIIGRHTTLRVAAGSGNYLAMLAGASQSTDLSGLSITGVIFDQNAAANPIKSVSALYHGSPRFVILVTRGSGITIGGNQFLHANNVDTIATGQATSNVTISGNVFRSTDAPLHDHSSVYTSGTGTVISKNSFIGAAMYEAAAIEVHGDRASIRGNRVRGYFRGVNIVCSDTTFSRNSVVGAASPVELWSMVSPGLSNVQVTGNLLNRNLGYWARVLRQHGQVMPPPRFTRQVGRYPSSTFPFRRISIRSNKD